MHIGGQRSVCSWFSSMHLDHTASVLHGRSRESSKFISQDTKWAVRDGSSQRAKGFGVPADNAETGLQKADIHGCNAVWQHRARVIVWLKLLLGQLIHLASEDICTHSV